MPALRAEEPVHVRIDQLTDSVRTGPAAPAADDATFLRRAHLVFTGIPPSAEDVRAFTTDPAPGKRAALITRLSGSPEFNRQLAVQLDVLLMERRAEMHTKSADWRQWLENSLAAGMSWDQLVTAILAADGSDEKTRPVARWLLERESEPNLLTRDAGRLFLGRDMACAQCHDHPRIDDYAQRDYHGLYAFFGRTWLFQPDTNKPALVAEKASGDATFVSVFTRVSGTARPHLPGDGEIAEPPSAGEEWVVAPNDKDKNVRPVPKYSRRSRLAESLVNSPAFRRNIGNRLWGLVMGRCLVEPPDLIHSANAPAHPAVLDAVADGIAAMKYDVRGFMRELALTKTFAQAFDPSTLPAESGESLSQQLPALEAEAARLDEAASQHGVAFSEKTEALEKLQLSSEPVIAEWTKALAATAGARKATTAATAALKEAETAKTSLTESIRVLTEAAQAAAATTKNSPDDKELAAALKTFQDKAAASQATLPAADKTLAERQTALTQKEAAAVAAEQFALTKKPAADESSAKIAEALKSVAEANALKQSARLAANEAALRVKEAKAMTAFTVATANAAPVLAAAEQKIAEYTAAAVELAPHTKQIDEARRELPVLEKSATDAATAMATATKASEAAQAHLAALRDASSKAVIATQKLPGDKEIDAAAKTIQAKSDAAMKDAEAKTKLVADATSVATQAAAKLSALKETLTKAEAARAAVEQKLAPLKTAADDAEAKAVAARAPVIEARQSLAAVQTGTFSVAGLTAMPPEQFCWSILKVTGTLGQLREQSAKEWDEKNKPTEADKADPAKQAARTASIEALTRGKIQPHENQFVRLFGNSAGQPQSDFFATADQALYFENAGQLRSWCQPSGDNLAGRLVKLNDPQTFAEELYLNTLTRLPDAAEVADLTQLITSRPPDQKAAAVGDALWAVLTSLEFRFRH